MTRSEKGFKGAKLVGAKLDSSANISVVSVSVSAGQPSGTATVVAGSTVLGIYPTGNQDQFVDNVAISSTTLTVTLAANATATNTFKIPVLLP